MSITKNNPNTVLLSGPCHVIENEYPAGEEITPGHLIELYDDSGTIKWRKHASADEKVTVAVALEQEELNKTVDDVYAEDDLVKAAFLGNGATFWGLIASGQDISNCEFMQSAGNGTLKTAGATTQAAGSKFQSLEAPGAVTELTRVRVQVVS